ncbi:cation efflux family protein [Arthrobacter sp. SLBN-100]|uniref:cation diffusion facilitator family transporter n=1 Tax=Arthrobacter sp. SLBN-100 TaxID=2768450 RepID=UPI00115074BB|nr:cation transporter [Arthrobacter sp. SLBN-100]TQJ66501.1 cation efflux family protein [Arthrobacter sp. SLBN-100]
MTALLQRLSSERRALLNRRIRLFAAATITYNLIEAVVALWAGNVAGSVALIGFGLDSVIEVTSALALSWQFSAKDPERREHLTLRIIAISFFALAAFVTMDAVRSLTGGEEAQHSTPGIVIAALSLAIMPVLSWAQRRAGRELGSRTAVADSKQTLLCTYLSAVLLVGLVLNSTLGWWWADAGAALIIAGIAVREGVNAWRGEACCALPRTGDVHGHGEEDDDCCAPATTVTASAVLGARVDLEQEGGCCAGCQADAKPAPGILTLGTKPVDR